MKYIGLQSRPDRERIDSSTANGFFTRARKMEVEKEEDGITYIPINATMKQFLE